MSLATAPHVTNKPQIKQRSLLGKFGFKEWAFTLLIPTVLLFIYQTNQGVFQIDVTPVELSDIVSAGLGTAEKPTRICVNLIVKNEAEAIVPLIQWCCTSTATSSAPCS